MRDKKTDIVIIGGGVIGITLALEARRRLPDQHITIIEKESNCGTHASGRNSGVLHAGFYYSSNSLKAQLCRDGNRAMTEYALARGLPINRCGKLVVARNEADLAGLDELYRRGQINGIELQQLSAADAAQIEPRAITHQRALFSPTTASVDPQQIMTSLTRDATEAGIEIQTDTHFIRRNNDGIVTNHGAISAGYVINAAGLYADKIAHHYGFADEYRILPFKGIYLYGRETIGALKIHVYPVPELDKPFLGVHFTLTMDGHYKIGPTAIPAFWRQQYSGMEGFRVGELIETVATETALLFNNRFGFSRLAINELAKYYRPHLIRQAAQLISGIDANKIGGWGKAGIRAQLVNIRSRSLEMDFCWRGDERSFHILNAVSPAFTCSMPLASYCMDKIEALSRR